MLRSLGSVKELIEQFLAMPLEDVDKKGRNPITDRHYLGLKRSVLMAYQRLRESGEEEALADAEALLVTLSLLPSSTVPTTLFVSDNPRHVVMPFRPGQQCRGRDSAPSFYRARELLVRHGLAKEAADPSHAAITHQLVQRVVRQHLLRDSRLVEVRGVLHERLVLARNLSDDADLRSVLPCVEWWCQEGKATDVERGVEELRLQIDMADAQLCQGRYEVAIGWQRHAKGRLDEHFPAENRLRCRATVEQGICLLHGHDPTSALCLFDTALLYIPEGDPLRTIALNCRAACLDKLGRHEEAVEEHRRVLGLRIRMDEPPHAVATSMNNLASALYKCGDASRRPVTLVLQREVLRIRRACLPAGHMDIGAALGQIANTYKQLKQPREAIPREEEALDIFRATLGPHHEYIARVLANLSQSYEKDSQFAKARDKAKEALNILPEGHFDSMEARMKLGGALGKLGDSSEQKRHFQRAVELLRIANPPQPLALASALCDLATVTSSNGPTEESLRLLEEARDVRKSALGPGDPRVIELERVVAMVTFTLMLR